MINNAFIKFHQLPQELKRAVTTPRAMQQLDTLEKKYHAPLADVIVRLMVRELPLSDAEAFFRSSLNMPPERASALNNELRYTVLNSVLEYLEGPAGPPSPPKPISALPQEMNVATPGEQKSSPVPVAPRAPVPPPSVLPVVPAITPAAPTAAGRQPTTPLPSPPSQSPRRPKLPQTPFSRVTSGKAAYYVFAEDEAEIAKHRDRLGRLGGDSPTAQLDGDIAELINKHGLAFEDETIEKRFRGLVLSCLRDVRTTAELQELLERSQKIGGMGYDQARASAIVMDVSALVVSLHDRDVAGHLAEPRAPKPKPVLSPLSTRQPEMPGDLPSPPPSPVPPEPLVARPPAPPPQMPKEPVPPIAPPPGEARMTTKPLMAPLRPPIRRPAIVTQMNPRVIQDIRQPQKPVGLVEELGMLTLDDFRRLGRDLEECVAKVIEKVQLLSEESYEKRAEGVAAWRKSEVHQLYLAMGRESMAGNKSIDEIMADRKRQGQSYLTAVEFTAIADLNHQMML